MKIALLVFSGSGNTQIIAKKYLSILNERDFDTDILLIEKEILHQSDLNQYDKIGVFYPLHGFNTPSIIYRYLKVLNKLEKPTTSFNVMVSGEPINLNHSSSIKLNRKLKKKNIICESEYHYVLGYNMIFRHTEEKAYKLYDATMKIIPLDIEDYFIRNKTNKLKRVFGGRFISFVIRIQYPFYRFNGHRFKVDMNKCSQCMRCVKSCPTNNISFQDDKFIFAKNCVMCTRCSFNCPKDAFNIHWLNKWRVNKPYAYKPNPIKEVDKHPKYCKKAYDRYFAEIDKRLSEK